MKATLILAIVVAASSVSAYPSTPVVKQVQSPTPSGTPAPVQNQDESMSGGAIAGVVIGCLAAVALAGLLAWCWRRKRSQHVPANYGHVDYESQNRAPTRTIITEKVEPVVVKSGTHQPYSSNVPAINPNTSNTQSVPVSQGDNTASTTLNTGSSNVHPSTSYNTTTAAGYNTANNGHTSTSNTYNTGIRDSARGSL